MGSLFGYKLKEVLYDLTFAQALTLIDVRNEREKKQNERSKSSSGTDTDLSDIGDLQIDENDDESIPHMDDVRTMFGNMLA
jgi:hypothetical protein